jgi:acyl-CoA synthetase (AMP-forming)/AMP-acid ligase II
MIINRDVEEDGLRTLQNLLESSYDRYAGLPAVSDDAGSLSYSELADLVSRMHTFLAAHGVSIGDRVGVLGANSVDYVIVDQACFTSGVVRVGINRRSSTSEVAALAAAAGLSVLFADAEWSARLAGDLIEGVLVIDLESAPEGRLRDRVLAVEPASRPPRLEESDPAALIFTSGTTGAPKAIIATQGNLAGTVRNVLVEVPVAHDASVLHPIPLSHAAMQLSIAFQCRGARQHYVRQTDPGAILDAVARGRYTIVTSVPTVVGMLAREQAVDPRDLGSLRAIVYGGSSISAEDLRAAVASFGPTLFQMYAQSERSLPLTCLDPFDHLLAAGGDATLLASAGRPGPFIDLTIVDDEGRELPPGEPGEIVVRGDTVTLGYLGDEEATFAAFDDAGRLRTGDVGYLTRGGYLVIVDRLKDVIISGGFNVFPSEVENALRGIPGLVDLAVYGIPDAKWGELVCVAVVGDDRVTLEVVQAAARELLSGYKVPRVLRRHETLPLNATGKVLRRLLRERHDA